MQKSKILENEPKGKKSVATVTDFDSFIGAVKRIQQRALDEGRPHDSTAIDKYINTKKKQAGSPPTAFEPDES